MKKIKICIVDDNLLFVGLLKDYFNTKSYMEVIYTASSGNDFLSNYKEQSIDILLLDLKMNNGSGLDVLQELNRDKAEIKSIVLSSYYKKSFTGQMLQLGTNAFLPKELGLEELVKVIECVDEYGCYFSQDQHEVLRKQLSNNLPKFDVDNEKGVSPREVEILKLLCNQLTTKQIAEKLFISPKTVETHKSNLLLKLEIKNSSGLIIYAIQKGIIDPNELILL